MNARMEIEQFGKTAEAVATALRALSKAVTDSGLDPGLIELIKIRASQQNGCAFSTQFHLNAARRLGVAEPKLGLVAVWRDAGIFTPRETAALAWSEALTGLTPAGVNDKAYTGVTKEFSTSELAFLTSAVAAINAWNRIAMAYRFTPLIPQDLKLE